MSQICIISPKIRMKNKHINLKPRKTRNVSNVIFFGFLLLPWVAAFLLLVRFFFVKHTLRSTGLHLGRVVWTKLVTSFLLFDSPLYKMGCVSKEMTETKLLLENLGVKHPFSSQDEEMVVSYIVNLVVLKWK